MDSSTIIKDDIFLSDKLVRFINRVRNSEISSIRSIVNGIFKAANDPSTCAKELKQLIAMDPPLAAAILKTANSALFSPRGGVSDITQAIIRLGFKTVTEIALSQKVCQLFKFGESPLERKQLWLNSSGTAILTREIQRKEFGAPGSELYVAGLLHRLGMVVFDQFLHKKYIEIIGVWQEKSSLREAEISVLGFGHAEVAASLAEAWNFPLDLIVMLRYYFEPFKGPENFQHNLMILYVADTYCRMRGLGLPGMGRGEESRGLFEKCLDRLCIDLKTLEMLMPAVEDEVKILSDMGLE